MPQPHTPTGLRTRAPYLALALGTLVVGLAVHRSTGVFAPAARDLLGDALWAAMLVWGVAAVVPRAAMRTRSAGALALCFAVEFGQLVHTPTLNALRRTTAGHLVLGSGFNPRDLAAYTIGVLVAALLEHAVARRRNGRT